MESQLSSQEKIDIYKNLLKGRDDVFAVRWQKADGSASGYTPVCTNEWKKGLCNKLLRKKCKDCPHKDYAKLDDYHIEQHLRGNKVYGVYPLLDDNSSYFIAADFDGNHWQEEATKFARQCQKHGIEAYLERSRSGNGAHVWIFFEEKYPAYKSRSIATNILKEAEIIDQFDKDDSFDRLFPNQDMHGGEGMGNLIALPLQGESRKLGNSVFINYDNNFEMVADQWEFLKQAKKISTAKLDNIWQSFNSEAPLVSSNHKNKLTITLKEQLYILKNNLPKSVAIFLKDNLNLINADFLIKKKMGMSVYGLEKYFKLIHSEGELVALPRGFSPQLTDFLNEKSIKYEIMDKRFKSEPIEFSPKYKLFDYQSEAVESMLNADNGVLVAPPGSGKTVMGIDLIAKLKQPTLILVHKKQIYNQWLDRIESFLAIPKRDIGQFCASKRTVGKKITVAMVQTLNKIENIDDISSKVGLVIVDECHHVPARMFRNVITKLRPHYLYGMTATPERKNNDEKLIHMYLGEILHVVDKNYEKTKTILKNTKTSVIIRETTLEIPFKVKPEDFEIPSKIIIFDSNRNNQIVEDIKIEADKMRKCLVLTERKEHAETLNEYLKDKYEVVLLTGNLTDKRRKERIAEIEAGNFQIIIATGQLIGEGTDFANLDCLFLVYPFSFHGKLTQYIGRIQRGENRSGKIYDYRDAKVEYLERLFKKRLSYYKKNFDL